MNIYAEEFDTALHREDLMARIERAGFGQSEQPTPEATRKEGRKPLFVAQANVTFPSVATYLWVRWGRA